MKYNKVSEKEEEKTATAATTTKHKREMTHILFLFAIHLINETNAHSHSILPYHATHIDAPRNRNTLHLNFNRKRKRKRNTRQCEKEANWCKCEPIQTQRFSVDSKKRFWAINQSALLKGGVGTETRPKRRESEIANKWWQIYSLIFRYLYWSFGPLRYIERKRGCEIELNVIYQLAECM